MFNEIWDSKEVEESTTFTTRLESMGGGDVEGFDPNLCESLYHKPWCF
jgi:hypothetical protein